MFISKPNQRDGYSSQSQLSLLIHVLAFCLPLLAASLSRAGTIEGVVFSENGPAKDSTVYAYRTYDDLVNDRVFRTSERGEREGQYSITLPAGSFYLVARANIGTRHLFSYHGVNPITITSDYRWLPFLLVPESILVCRESPGISRIRGRALYKNEPVSGGVISVYTPKDGKLRGMGLLTNTLDETGSFTFDLEPGSYTVVARKKQDIKGIGPVKQGDMFCYPSSNPINLTKNTLCDISFNCYPRDDLSFFLAKDAVNPQGRRHESRRLSSLYDLQPEEGQKRPDLPKAATISGVVTNQDGTPLPGMIVTAYPSNGVGIFQMHILRLITSNMGLTDGNGRYNIDLRDTDPRYYIVAREKLGEAPDRNEHFGLYEGSFNHSVTVNDGEHLNGIDIVTAPLMPERTLGDHRGKH